MKYHNRRAKYLSTIHLVIAVAAVGGLPNLANAAEDPGAIAAGLAKQGAAIAHHNDTGKVRFIGTHKSAPIFVSEASRALLPTDAAMAIAQAYGPLFGLRDPQNELRVMRQQATADKRTMTRYQQVHKGVPVIGGELIVNMDSRKNMTSMSGEISPDLALSVTPAVTPNSARSAALASTSRAYNIPANKLQVSEPALWIYDPQLISPSKMPRRLVWRLEVRTDEPPLRELVLVDAHTGGIQLSFNQIHTLKNRITYDAENIVSNNLPGGTKTTPVCDETSGDACTNGARPDADLAHKYAGDTYDFFFNQHGRDSLNNAGMTLISTVRFCPVGAGCPYQNAFWNGTQMAYGAGFAAADDVVGHELTHGVTEFTSNLFYWYQSGAINESFSDLWGEFVDLTNTGGTDTPGVRWQMGEDVPVFGAIRNMADPTIFGDPDRMTSLLYFEPTVADFNFGTHDNGGVHINSGINNKAAYLMTDGDSFNGYAVVGLGIPKVADIYYEAQTNLLTSGMDYNDLHNALGQACQNLIGGVSGITATDCLSVINATKAVEMDQQPIVAFNPDAQVCPTGKIPNNVFADDFEGSLSTNWQSSSLVGARSWGQLTPTNGGPYATSGTKSAYIWDTSVVSDTVLTMKSGIVIPAGAYLHFSHAYIFQHNSTGTYFDGAVLEYTTNNGVSWNDAAALFDAGRAYGGTISTSFSNPIGGRQAFVGPSNGFVSSRYNLSSLAGSTVKFRYRHATDNAVAWFGWFVDDVKIYTCTNAPRTMDFNGDIKSDLLWRHTSGVTVQWLMDGSSVTGSAGLGGDTDWQVTQSGDFNGDGKVDLIWRHTSGLTFMWLMDGSTVLDSGGIGGDPDWHAVATGDFNGDGKTDILWRHISGLTVMWLMDGMTVLSSGGIGGDPDWHAIATGDLDRNGKADILWRHTSGLTVVWFMNGLNVASAAGLGGDSNWTVVATGDFNGDGSWDILWRHTTGVTIMWLMDGTAIVNSTIIGGDSDWTVVKTGDYNGDGRYDILWRHVSGLVVQWLMFGGTTTGSAGIGGDSNWSLVP